MYSCRLIDIKFFQVFIGLPILLYANIGYPISQNQHPISEVKTCIMEKKSRVAALTTEDYS